MKTQSKVQLLVVLSLIVAKCLSLQQQFSADGALSVVLFGGVALLASAALLRRSTGLAFVLATGATFSAFGLAREFIFAESHSAVTGLLFAREEAMYLVLAYCLFNLWAEWRKAEALAEAKA